jgi:hypothetical protein
MIETIIIAAIGGGAVAAFLMWLMYQPNRISNRHSPHPLGQDKKTIDTYGRRELHEKKSGDFARPSKSERRPVVYGKRWPDPPNGKK